MMDTSNLKHRLDDKLQSRQAESMEEKIMTMPTVQTALTEVRSNYVALTSDALSIIKENLKNQPLSHALFNMVKSPSGEATAFTVPGLSGDEIQKELTGIILDYTTPRAYWDTPDPVEGTPPVCYSSDSLISNEGKPCCQCPFNDFGSRNADTNAKACKEFVELFLLRPDNILPLIVRIPVSSKISFFRYSCAIIELSQKDIEMQ